MERSALLACAVALSAVACQILPEAGLAPTNAPSYLPASSMPPIATPASGEIVGPVWQWQRTQRGSAPVDVSAAPERYTLTFQEGGRVNVRADCNRGSGSYEVNGAQIKFGPIALTRMGCPPGSQDADFLRTLAQAASYAMDRGELVLKLFDGASMRFKPAQ